MEVEFREEGFVVQCLYFGDTTKEGEAFAVGRVERGRARALPRTPNPPTAAASILAPASPSPSPSPLLIQQIQQQQVLRIRLQQRQQQIQRMQQQQQQQIQDQHLNRPPRILMLPAASTPTASSTFVSLSNPGPPAPAPTEEELVIDIGDANDEDEPVPAVVDAVEVLSDTVSVGDGPALPDDALKVDFEAFVNATTAQARKKILPLNPATGRTLTLIGAQRNVYRQYMAMSPSKQASYLERIDRVIQPSIRQELLERNANKKRRRDEDANWTEKRRSKKSRPERSALQKAAH